MHFEHYSIKSISVSSQEILLILLILLTNNGF